jgi:hypothetical protein
MSTTAVYVLKKQGLEDEKIQQALEMLLIDRRNEFRELSEILLRTQKSTDPVPNSEQFILNFCLDVNEAFQTWTGKMILTNNSPQKALTILRQLSREKTTMNQLTHFLNISFTLADEFKEIYRRLK